MLSSESNPSPLGPPEQWPEALRTAVGIMLGSRIPAFVAWGPELIFLCNDGCAGLVRRDAPGGTLAEAWTEVWDEIGPLAGRALAGERVVSEVLTLTVRGEIAPRPGWFTLSLTPLFGAGGAVQGLFGEAVNVTGQELTEQELRESEERFRLIADSAPALMWVTQLDRKRSFVNRAYVDFLGITYEEAVDFDWRSVLHPEDHDRIVAESIAGEASMKPFALEARYRSGNGEWRWVRSISQPRLGPNGEHIGFIGVAHDITDAKQAEAALREVNETLERRVAERTADLSAALDRVRAEIAERELAEEALRQAQKMEAVGQLTGGIAHDFNNLLTPVIGGLEIIARSLEDPRLKRIAEAALESSRRGAKLTTQLLAFSRIQRLRVAPVSVNRVIETMGLMLKHSIGSDIAIRTELAEDTGHALCDENQLENAILNLAINARDAMPEGGTLIVSTRKVDEGSGVDLEEGAYVCISVADTGHGMTPDVLARATEPFFSTKPLGKGTGLGLAQVYGIARQARGTVRIESKAGEGTTVSILLPHAPPDAVAEEAVASERSGGAAAVAASGARILVVDDDREVRSFIGDALGSLGHQVEGVESGAAAIETLAGDPPDLILIDFAMPGMNGAQLAREVRRLHPRLPIAFVTGYAESDQLEDALGRDVPVLRKPFGVEQLADLLAAQLGLRTEPDGEPKD